MLNAGEVVIKDNKKYLFCGFEKKVVQARARKIDLGYRTELVVLGRVLHR